jgi:thiamine biosynthesis lipoprotein
MNATLAEQRETFPCFGSQCTLIVADPDPAVAAAALRRARGRLLEWHFQFSRFEADSELSRLNRDPRPTVPVSPMMRRIVDAGVTAAELTGGLVDPTLVDEIERVGYANDLAELAPSGESPVGTVRRAAEPQPDGRWRAFRTYRRAGSTVTRPPGTRFDSGGIAKGVFADELAATLAAHEAFVVDCGGDLRLGGAEAVQREVHVADPAGGDPLHTFILTRGAVATSGIARRSWRGPDGAAAHHLIDPRTGHPAFTGLIQVTALAPSGAEAEALSKAALLSGPGTAERFLPHGGVVVSDDGTVQVFDAAWPSSHVQRSSSTRPCSGSLKISW